VAALLEVLNGNNLPFDYLKTENVVVMKDTGSRILLRAVDEFERLRGTNLAWFGLDELSYSQEGSWLRLEGRLRDPKAERLTGFGVWTPKGFDWVYRKFIQKESPGYDVVLAQPYENRFLLDKVPDFYDRLKDSYDDTFFRQEVLGDYLNAGGALVYGAFSRLVNVRGCELEPAVPLCWAVDFNVDRGDCSLRRCLGGVDENDRAFGLSDDSGVLRVARGAGYVQSTEVESGGKGPRECGERQAAKCAGRDDVVCGYAV
jgi:hypothetical protein